MEIVLTMRKPGPEELELRKTQLNALAVAASKKTMTVQLEILSAESAEELAAAIVKFHGALAEAHVAWGNFADQVRHWAH